MENKLVTALTEITEIAMRYHLEQGNSPAANHCRNIALAAIAVYEVESPSPSLLQQENERLRKALEEIAKMVDNNTYYTDGGFQGYDTIRKLIEEALNQKP